MQKINIPANAVPVQPTKTGNSQRVNRPNTPAKLRSIRSPTIRSFREHLENQPEWKLELLYGSFTAGTIDTLREHTLQENPICMCSDGVAKGNTGSYGWVIATEDKPLWECVGMRGHGHGMVHQLF
jgi:hypothetical protein